MVFKQAIREAHKKNLRENKKALVMGLGVTYTKEELADEFPMQVLDTPVSESAITGMAVGLASQGFRPVVVHGRIEFALLAMDQILTQASRWDFMFGGDYPCPVSFRIGIGRQWGNGPQHTANYHTIFLQSTGLDVFIPSTPKEAFEHIRFMSINDKPSVLLEHRWLYKTHQQVDCNLEISRKLPLGYLYKFDESSQFLILTYGDGLVDSLKTLKYLRAKGIGVSVLNLSSFPCSNRLDMSIVSIIKQYRNIIVIDNSPIEFGLMSGVIGQILLKNKISSTFYHLSPPFYPCPTSTKLANNYYVNYSHILKKVSEIMNTNFKDDIELNFTEMHMWPEFDFGEFNNIPVYEEQTVS